MSKRTKMSVFAAIGAGLIASSLGVIAPAAAFEGEKPKLQEAFPPEYPRAAMRRNLQGKVVMDLTIDEKGKVAEVVVVEADMPGVFDKAAMAAAKKWKYEKGKPFTPLRATLKFELEDG